MIKAAIRWLSLVFRNEAAAGKVFHPSLKCPECGSSRIEFPQFSRRTLMGALPAALAATGVIAQEYYCESCHFTWPAEVKAEPELDILNWPKTTHVP